MEKRPEQTFWISRKFCIWLMSHIQRALQEIFQCLLFSELLAYSSYGSEEKVTLKGSSYLPLPYVFLLQQMIKNISNGGAHFCDTSLGYSSDESYRLLNVLVKDLWIINWQMTGSIFLFAAEIAPERLNKVKRCSLPLSNLMSNLKLYLESK